MRYGRSMRAGVAVVVCLAAVTVSGSTGLARSAGPATARLAHSAPSWAAGAPARRPAPAAQPLARAVLIAPPWAPASLAPRAAPASQRLAVRVYLAPRGGTAGLDAAIRTVSTPGSPS